MKPRSRKALNIRAFPEDLLSEIKSRAKAEHRTMRKWLLGFLREKLNARNRRSDEPPQCPEEGTLMKWNELSEYFQCPECGFVLKPVD